MTDVLIPNGVTAEFMKDFSRFKFSDWAQVRAYAEKYLADCARGTFRSLAPHPVNQLASKLLIVGTRYLEHMKAPFPQDKEGSLILMAPVERLMLPLRVGGSFNNIMMARDEVIKGMNLNNEAAQTYGAEGMFKALQELKASVPTATVESLYTALHFDKLEPQAPAISQRVKDIFELAINGKLMHAVLHEGKVHTLQ